MAITRYKASVMSISWIPSDAIAGLSKMPFKLGVTHYDQIPPDQLQDLEELRRTDRFRGEANELRAFIEVEDGRIVGYGHLGQGHIARRRFASALPPFGSRPSTCPTSCPSPR